MRTTVTQPRLRVAFAEAFAVRLEERVRAHLDIPCDVIRADEDEIVSRLPEIDILVTIAFTPEMGAAGRRLKLVQVPGAGLDRIDRSALPTGTWLANVYGHEVGIAEYVIGAMLALTRGFARLDACLRQGHWESQWAVSTPPPAPWPELAGKTLGIIGYGRIGQCVARRAQAFDMAVWAIRRDIARSDVWYQYPAGPGPTFPAHHAFQALPNVLMTPHVSGWTEGMLEARATLIAENIQRAARGEPPVHLIPASAA